MDKRITIRIPNKLYEKLKQQSDETGYTLSETIRIKLQGNRGKIINKKLTKEFVYELNRIGNNLNQITKYCNTTKTIDKLVFGELVEIEKSLQQLLEILEMKKK